VPTTEPRAAPGDIATKQLGGLRDYARAAAGGLVATGSSDWYRPQSFASLLTDSQAIAAAFSRQEQGEAFRQIVTQATPGTTTDLALTQIQGDLMGCLERAFRARHATAVRTRLLPAGRLQGHGADAGVLAELFAGYLTSLDRLNKSET
jgi:hypothetical protein